MTRREALRRWRREVRDRIPANDLPARRESFSRFVDALHRDGEISDRQAWLWDQPPENK